MEIETAAEFLVGSILFGIGFCIIAVGLVVVNNIFHKYWKPVTIWLPKYMDQTQSTRFATDEEMAKIAPTMDPDPSSSTKR
jgi:hypothetical protein